jgi:3-oxoacyl-[acyl-carrier-protein] synthase II
MSQSRPRVVITGFGLVSPLGCDLETVWKHLCAGTSGISRLERLPAENLPFEFGGEAKGFTGHVDDYGPLDKKLQRAIKKNMKVMCREIEMGVAACQKALVHSGLGPDRDPDRCGCHFGCEYILTRPEEYADGVVQCREQAGGEFRMADWPHGGLQKVNPLWLLKYLPNMPNSHVSIYNDFRGPNNAITLREASLNLALWESSSIIQRGAADVMLVGATGTRIHPLQTIHVAVMEQLASRRDNPAEMARPFDSAGDGIVLGEGAGAIVLESLEHAQSRGAEIWGEVVGAGASMVARREGRDHLYEAIKNGLSATLSTAAERLGDAWHVHAQGCGLPTADRSESLAIGEILPESGPIPVTACSSYVGSLGAGGAAVDIISSLLALKHGKLFPILNLDSPADHVRWQPATHASNPGCGFIHSSYTMQGQAASLAVASF